MLAHLTPNLTLRMSRRLLPFVCLASLLLAQATELPEPKPPAALQAIVAKELLEHATWLAADEREGRLTGSPGQWAAARYIAAHFEKLGLEPLGDEVDGKRTWFQHYGIARTFVDPKTELQLGECKLRDGFAVLGGKAIDVQLKGELQFCGLGRTPKDLGAEVDLAGKIAVVAIKGPRGKVGNTLGIEQKFAMSFGVFQQLSKTTKALAKKGAVAVLFVQHEDRLGLSDVLNYLALAPGKDQLAATFLGPGEDMNGMLQMLGGGGSDTPTMVLSVPASGQLFEQLGLEAAAVGQYVDAGEAMPTAKAGVAAEVTLSVGHDDKATACNVVAVLRGSDPKLAPEAVVYSAHMDHVGKRIDGEIFNGADDNASGSAGLMSIARAYAESKEKPRRSVIFLSVSGEELGLWGSAYFAQHPTWAADQLVANVNTDMIGRNGPESEGDEVMVTPSNRHAKFSTIVQDAAKFGAQLGFTFASGDKYYSRSDHYNFAKKGIPVVFFCNGEHADYHQVSDTADKLDGSKMERIARLAFWTGWSVANADDRPRTLGKQESWR